MPKNASEVTLVPKIYFFLTILNFVQSYVECEVILADGTVIERRMIDKKMSSPCFSPEVDSVWGFGSPGTSSSALETEDVGSALLTVFGDFSPASTQGKRQVSKGSWAVNTKVKKFSSP
jgi:hypothetical protein